MSRLLKIYKPFTHAGVLLAAQYRVNFIFFMLGDILRCFISYFLWHAVYSAGGEETFMGFSETDMVVYIFVSFLTSVIAYSDGAYMLGEEIRDGNISMRIIKPIRFDIALLFQELGERTIGLSIAFVPMVFGVELYKFIVTGSIMFSPVNFLFYLLSLVLSYLISFYFNLCFGYSAFVLKNLWGSNFLKDCIVNFLSGGVIPLSFMPAGLGAVLGFLPFASLIYTPVMIYTGLFSPVQIVCGIGLQLFWLAFFVVMQTVIWNAAVKHISIQGG